MGHGYWTSPLELLVYRPSSARFGAHFVVTSDPSAASEVIIRVAERARQAAWALGESWADFGTRHYAGRSHEGLRRHLALASVASWLQSDR